MAPVRSSSAQGASSSTKTCRSPTSYDVFLSFRGEDTRKTFTDHLYTALVSAGLRTFRDEDELERGEDINLGLKKAIQESQSSVIVFSKHYASSAWCLDELVTIMELNKAPDSDHVVLPVFYDIDPSQVRKQTGSVAVAFARHEKRQPSYRINRWREALRKVADLAGMVLQSEAQGYESKFIKKIVQVIEDKLRRTPLVCVDPNLIGMHSRVKNINLWLDDGSIDVSILAIYGMSGIGKTTIAKFVYNLNFRKFERSSFLENVKQISEEPNGVIRLQTQLLCDLLNKGKIKVQSVGEGIVRIKDAVRSKRVLLVLDDMDQVEQLDAILGMKDQFHSGSKIIITTSHARLLKTHHHVMKVHNVTTFAYSESLKLFSQHAFGQDRPPEGYMEHAKAVVNLSEGLPLALKILGSSLSGQSTVVWQSALEKLKAIPNGEILKKLRISFDSLQDNHDRRLFLHIACFFTGRDKEAIVTILNGCDFYTIVGIQNLIDRCLVTIDQFNKVQMHNMIRDMGRGIVRLESEEPRKRSRLWNYEDSRKVLTEKNGTEKIEGLILHKHMHLPYGTAKHEHPANCNAKRNHPAYCTASKDSYTYLDTSAFSKMQSLSLLELCNVQLNGSYEYFPRGIKWLCWHESHIDCIPDDFPLSSLVGLKMCYNSLKKIWKKTEHLPSLKILNLSYSHCLTETPDFLYVPNLESLYLKDCKSLVAVHESIGNLEKLLILNLEDCQSIKKLPRSISKLKSLETLVISGCSNLEDFPVDMRNIKSLKVFEADGVSIHRLLCHAAEAEIWPRKVPEAFWSSYLPCNLVDLSLGYCNLRDDDFPNDFLSVRSLRRLNLAGNPICSLPVCIKGLTNLDALIFSGCRKLKSLEKLPRVGILKVSNCTSLEKLTYQSILNIPERISIESNTKLVEVEYCFKLVDKIDKEMISLLGLGSFTSTETVVLETRHPEFCRRRSMTSLQGLYEKGIFSTFLPGAEFGGQFSHRTKGSSIYFTIPLVPQCAGFLCLNFFCLYAKSNDDPPKYMFGYPIVTARVMNIRRGLEWSYSPFYTGVPSDEGKCVTWLSHWRFGNQLEGGDAVLISVSIETWLKVMECGVHVVYEQQENISASGSSAWTHAARRCMGYIMRQPHPCNIVPTTRRA